MKYSVLLLFIIFQSQTVFSQNLIIPDEEKPALNKIIDSLEIEYQNSSVSDIRSLPQTTGDYFEVKTKNPGDFILAMRNDIKSDSLVKRFRNLQIDRDLLILKNEYHTTNGDHKLEIKSFKIKNNNDHRINIEYSDSLNEEGVKFFYTSYTYKKTNTTTIRGFKIKDDFSQINLPERYADWVLYTDFLVVPEQKLFLDTGNNASPLYNREKSIIDSLVNYYAEITNKPKRSKNQDFLVFRKELEKWEDQRSVLADSLYENDFHFKDLLEQALNYAESEKKSNGELEYFTADLISRKRALNLMRFNQQVGSCSFDNGPINQQKRMAKLAAEIPNWGVFIKSFLNVMNDNVSRVANSNIASNSRKTYIEELSELKLDIRKLLLGSNMRIDNSDEKHYFSDGAKIGKAFSALSKKDQAYFEKTIAEIIQDEKVDAFNKLHFYNTISNYQYFLKDSIRKQELDLKIKTLEEHMPEILKSRFEDPNKELKDLLYTEKNELEKFEILDITIGNVYSYSYGGECWMAELRDKDEKTNIIYDLTMPIEDSITPLRNFLNKKDDLTKRVKDHPFINELLSTNSENQLYLKFTGNKSFSNYGNRVSNDFPEDLQKLDYNNALSFYISYPDRRYVRYILLENKNVIMLGIPKDYTIPGYSFKELLTKEEETLLSNSYYSYKMFNENGEMLN